ncbi:MAG: putative membrane protein [Cenarchaeum symbiont of Oopsacas minuta]|nr:putative membrane protein [Cenarchaeum symbiont of Oopsacas minuta]
MVTVGFFSIWFVCFVCDAAYTILNKRMIHYESNIVFSVLYTKLGLFAVPIQALVDLGFVLLITTVMSGFPNFGYMSVIAVIFGLLHLDAYYSNRKFIRNFP